jgi:hypothetical protein
MSDWIKTDDRLPDEDSIVLVTGWAYNKPDTTRFVATARRMNGAFVNDDIGDDLYWPTHWMPLPELPQ